MSIVCSDSIFQYEERYANASFADRLLSTVRLGTCRRQVLVPRAGPGGRALVERTSFAKATFHDPIVQHSIHIHSVCVRSHESSHESKPRRKRRARTSNLRLPLCLHQSYHLFPDPSHLHIRVHRFSLRSCTWYSLSLYSPRTKKFTTERESRSQDVSERGIFGPGSRDSRADLEGYAPSEAGSSHGRLGLSHIVTAIFEMIRQNYPNKLNVQANCRVIADSFPLRCCNVLA